MRVWANVDVLGACRKVAVQYVELCGNEYGGHNVPGKSQKEIAQELGIHERDLKRLLEIERKLTPEIKSLLATNFGRTKNDPTKQRKVAVQYVELCGLKHGQRKDYQTRHNGGTALTQSEIAINAKITLERTKKMVLSIVS